MKKRNLTLAEAMEANMGHGNVTHMYPTVISAAEKEAFRRAEIEHAPGVACRMNPTTFRVEYYEVATGKIVSSHI